jgi:hypothetical protein
MISYLQGAGEDLTEYLKEDDLSGEEPYSRMRRLPSIELDL